MESVWVMNQHTSTKLQIMNILLQVTRAKRLRWERVDPNTYVAEDGDLELMIIRKYPLLAGDDGSDADIAEVHVPGVTLTFYNGTEGFDLAMQALAESDPEWAGSMARWLSRAEQAIARLENLGRE
jgi:hypothetical protein